MGDVKKSDKENIMKKTLIPTLWGKMGGGGSITAEGITKMDRKPRP